MASIFDPIEAAFGRYLQAFHAGLVGDTPAMREFSARPFAKSAVWAPGRMIDQAEEMLKAWRKNDTSQADQATPYLPVMIAAMSKDFTPAPPEFSRGLSDAYLPVTIPGDVKERVFYLRGAVSDVRAQVAIFSAEPDTAKSIAMQLHTYASAIRNRRFYATYKLAGVGDLWPVVLELPDLMSVPLPTEVKNMTVLTVDISMRATIPLLVKPVAGAADADGKGTGSEDDPDGFMVVSQADLSSWPGAIGDGTADTWSVP